MVGESLGPLFDIYIELNRTKIAKKLTYFEDFRNREELLRDYSSKLSEFDKVQSEADLSRFKGQFEKIKNEIEDFNPHNIEGETLKVNNLMILVDSIKEEYNSISGQMKQIENSWIKFRDRNTLVKNSFFEDSFLDLYKKTWNIIEDKGASEMSSVTFAVSALNRELTKTIEIVEKINIFLNLYVFIGEEAALIRDRLKKLLDISSYENKSIYLSEIDTVFSDIDFLIEKSLVGTVGIEVVKVSSKSGISKFTLKFDDKLVAYDPFFENKGSLIKGTGKYIYLDNFPYEGIFKGRDLVSEFNISSDYYSSLLDIKSKMTKFFKIGIFSLIGVSTIGMLFESQIINFVSLSLILGFFFVQGKVLDSIVSSNEKKYGFKDIFLFTRIDFVYKVFGDFIDIRLLLSKTIESFDSTFLAKANKEKYLWIKKYQLAKNL